jgi:hypothetical protein
VKTDPLYHRYALVNFVLVAAHKSGRQYRKR